MIVVIPSGFENWMERNPRKRDLTEKDLFTEEYLTAKERITKKTVTVTRDDVNRASQYSVENNPIARAITKMIGKDRFITSTQEYVCFRTHGEKRVIKKYLPEEAVKFMEDFDWGVPVQTPFSFKL